jgi:phage terminase small subunit
MSALDNPKHERFAQELAKGKSQVEAYAEAGYKPSERMRIAAGKK